MASQAIVAGHVCIDIIPQFERACELEPGGLTEVGPALMATGGPVSNTGVALHILGIPTTLMGKVGDDPFGHSIVELFRARDANLAAGMQLAAGETTSYSVVLNIPGRDRSFLHCPGANHTFRADDVDYDQVAQARLFHFGYPPLMQATYANDGAELLEIFRRVKDAGLTTSLDLAMPDPDGPSGQANWQRILERVLPYVDIFLPSADELLFMLDRAHFGQGDDLEPARVAAMGERLLGMGVGVAGLKLGSRGLYLRTAGAERLAATGRGQPADLTAWTRRERWFPVYQVADFAGATGAGDTTIAGFLSALLRGMPLAAAGAAANVVGAMNVRAPDALSGLRDWDETMAAMDAMETAPLDLTDGDWRQEPSTGVWRGPADRA